MSLFFIMQKTRNVKKKSVDEVKPSFSLQSKKSKEIFSNIVKNMGSLVGDLDLAKVSSIKPIIEKSVASSLVFLNEDHGAGVCISKKGLVLTVYHAVEDISTNPEKRLMAFPNGDKVIIEVLSKNDDLDLALLKIVMTDKYKPEIRDFIQIKTEGPSLENDLIEKDFVYPFSNVLSSEENPEKNTPLFCIGNPPNSKSQPDYLPFHISFGRVKGYMKDDTYGDIEKGALKHSCWTYWGHSGGPIFNHQGEIVGLHNSWNNSTGTRHGVSLKAIQKFLKENEELIALFD